MRRNSSSFIAFGLIAFTLSPWLATLQAASLSYPPTRSDDVIEVIHGVPVEDPYRWLEDGDSQEVQAWTDAQNALTRAQLDQFTTQRRQLSRQLERLYRTTSESAPRQFGEQLFFTRREPDDNHAVVYAQPPGGREHVVINPNKFSESGNVSLDWWYPSPDAELIAFGKSADGSELSTLYLQDVKSGAELALEIPHTRACDVAWVDSRAGFYYTRYPAPGDVDEGDENYYRHVFYHSFGHGVGGWRQDLWRANR